MGRWNERGILDLYVNNVLVLDDATVASSTNPDYLDVDDLDYVHTDGHLDHMTVNVRMDFMTLMGSYRRGWNNITTFMTYTDDFSGTNVFANSVEGMNADGSAPAEWLTYPGYNFSVETTGNGIYNSDLLPPMPGTNLLKCGAWNRKYFS